MPRSEIRRFWQGRNEQKKGQQKRGQVLGVDSFRGQGTQGGYQGGCRDLSQDQLAFFFQAGSPDESQSSALLGSCKSEVWWSAHSQRILGKKGCAAGVTVLCLPH